MKRTLSFVRLVLRYILVSADRELPALVEPMRDMLKVGANLAHAKQKARGCPQRKRDWLTGRNLHSCARRG